MRTLGLFTVTAVAEIAGCYAAYAVLRLGRHPIWLLAAVAALLVFAWLLTLHPIVGAGRTYAAYGGIYIAMSLMWLWSAEGIVPDRWDLIGVTLCLAGTAVIELVPRS
jgi:small multidrug resistance family-3 protein